MVTPLWCYTTFTAWSPGSHFDSLELPYCSKFLLIAAYIASYNPPKTDKRFFLKNAGKIRKRTVQRGPEVKQKLIGPLNFSIDRLIAIFESITESTDRSATLLCQLRTLVKLKLILVGKFQNHMFSKSQP